jgi:hypothetical protein
MQRNPPKGPIAHLPKMQDAEYVEIARQNVGVGPRVRYEKACDVAAMASGGLDGPHGSRITIR